MDIYPFDRIAEPVAAPPRPHIRQRHPVVSMLDERLATLYIDQKYLRQVLIKPIKNAKECCEVGNTIQVATPGQVNNSCRLSCTAVVPDVSARPPDYLLDSPIARIPSKKLNPQCELNSVIYHKDPA